MYIGHVHNRVDRFEGRGRLEVSLVETKIQTLQESCNFYAVNKMVERSLCTLCRLTRIGGGNFWLHSKVWCLNFKPQYLQNFSSPTNDFYSVRKKSIRAFKSIFKLLGWGPVLLVCRTGSGFCDETLQV